MKRLLPILLVTTLLLAMSATVAFAAPKTTCNLDSETVLVQQLDNNEPEVAAPQQQDDGGEEPDDGGEQQNSDEKPEEEEKDTIGIDTVIGTLGLYAAMMAVLAVGTEVVIDMVRPVFGLQRKTTATEALSQLKEWLPATVKELGLPESAQKDLDNALKNLETVTNAFGAQAEKVRAIVHDQWPEILKALATQSVERVLQDHWPIIKSKLDQLGNVDTEKVRAWLLNTLNQLKGTNVADLQLLPALNGLLEEVEKRRNQIQGPLRKLWRWTRDRLIRWAEYLKGKNKVYENTIQHVLLVPAYIEYGWARMRGKLEGGVKVIEGIQKLGEPQAFQPLKSVQEAAQRILEEDVQHSAQEEKRVKWLRIISAVVGIVLAVTLQIDSVLLVKPVLGPVVDTFTIEEQIGEEKVTRMKTMEDILFVQRIAFRTPESKAAEKGKKETNDSIPLNLWDHACNLRVWVINWLLALTPGFILSGLGAAAGSGFWHDQLDKLRTAKQVSSQVQELAGQFKTLTGQGGEGGA
jgi:hypothetical protein